MDLRFVAPDLRQLDTLRTEAASLVAFEDERPLRGALGLFDWRLAGMVSRQVRAARFLGQLGECLLVPARPRLPFDKVFIHGGGSIEGFDDARFVAILESMLSTLDRARVRASAIALPGRALERLPAARAMELLLAGVVAHGEQDALVVIEDGDAQRAMEPIIERERRRARASAL